MTSLRPEYNDKIIEANLLAPVAILKGLRNPFYKMFANNYLKLKIYAKISGMNSIILNNEKALSIGSNACKITGNYTPIKCKFILSIIGSNQLNCVSVL